MRIYSNKKRPVKASKDYADFTGKDFDTAKAQLENDGYKEHEYGDTKEGNGYAVYRKGDKEVELTYEWVGTKNNAHAGKVLDVYVDEDINGACGKKSVKASTAGTIPYDLVSMLVALRDYISIDDTDYINDEHRMLVDVADSLYNAGITVAEMSPEYQAVYNKYGKDFFDLVLDDVAALDSQLTSNNVNDLIADYNDREATFTGVNASTKRRRNTKAVKASYDDRQILWVLDGDDNTWKCWGFAPNRFTLDIDHPDHQDPDELLEDFNYRNDANYTDYIVTYNGENPDDYGRTEPIKDKFVKASQTSVTASIDDGMHIIIDSKAYVDVTEYDFEQGAVGPYVNSWEFDVRGEYNSIGELVRAISENSYVFSEDVGDYYYMDGSIRTSATVDVDNSKATDAQIDAWQRGEEKLYIADMYLDIKVGTVHEMTEDEARDFGISIY